MSQLVPNPQRRTIPQVRRDHPSLSGEINRNGDNREYREFVEGEGVRAWLRAEMMRRHPFRKVAADDAEGLRLVINGCGCAFTHLETKQVEDDDDPNGFDLHSVFFIFRVVPCVAHQRLAGLSWHYRTWFVQQNGFYPLDAEMIALANDHDQYLDSAVQRGYYLESAWVRWLRHNGYREHADVNYPDVS